MIHQAGHNPIIPLAIRCRLVAQERYIWSEGSQDTSSTSPAINIHQPPTQTSIIWKSSHLSLNMSSSEVNVDALRFSGALAMHSFATEHGDTYPFIDPRKADLTGRSVVITGASRGIGRATAISFAQAGASKIGLAARSDLAEVKTEVLEAARQANRPEPLVVVVSSVDVTKEEDVKRFATTIQAEFGDSLDVLVNNAGILESWVPLGESDPSTWWKTWEVNLKGP
jgi:hypothetical protein